MSAMWKLEKDLCRCCHAEGSFKHLSDPCFLLGQEEIYSVMLKDCLDIKIVPMTGPLSDATYTICEACVGRLRDASNFKRQVQDCEQRFKEMYSKNMVKGFEVKAEPFEGDAAMKQESRSVDESDDDDEAFMKFDDELSGGDTSYEEHEEAEEMITVEIQGEPSKGKGKLKARRKTPNKRAKKEKPIKTEGDDSTEATASGEKKKGPNREEALISTVYAQFCSVLTTQEGEKKYACTQCDKQYDERKRLNAHYKTVHLRLFPTKKTRPCVICKEEVIPRNRWRHMEERHGWTAPTCPDCGRKFSYPFQVPVHQREVHHRLENLTFVCEQCGDKFSSLPRLKQHVIKHSDVKNYKCDQCPKAFKTITYLKQHMVRHSGVKGHICGECGAAFCNYKDLYCHITGKHALEKKFKCQFCSKAFKTRRLLNIHEKIHTGDKKHKCPVCEKAYVQSNNLKCHIRRKHPETVVKTEERPT